MDVWSAGVLIFQLLHGRLPYAEKLQGHSVREVWELILNSEIDLSAETWENFSQNSRDFVAALLERDPAFRLSAVEALNHPWLAEDLSAGWGVGGAQVDDHKERPLQRSIIQRLQVIHTHSSPHTHRQTLRRTRAFALRS